MSHFIVLKMKTHIYYVYILTNVHHTVFYTGVTNNLERRCNEHRNKVNKGFTRKYNVNKLVYYEKFSYILSAIKREKQIKDYNRNKKIKLINAFNAQWDDLFINNKVTYHSDTDNYEINNIQLSHGTGRSEL